jgi:hypothetical protein
LDISFECGVLPLLMGPVRPPGHALFGIHSNTGEREKINTLITYILQQVHGFDLPALRIRGRATATVPLPLSIFASAGFVEGWPTNRTGSPVSRLGLFEQRIR